MQEHTYNTYKIDEHPNPDLVYDWIRNNWHDLSEHCIDEVVDSLKGLASYFDAKLDYSISAVPDRGEYITLKLNDDISELSGVRLWKYLHNNYDIISLISGNCPFTGVCYDENLLDTIRDFIAKPDSRDFQELLSDCTSSILNTIHKETEYLYSDEALLETCEANEYDFREDGSIH